MMNWRFANEGDTSLILCFIRRLAEYEKMGGEVVATEEMLREWIFEKKKAEVVFALEEGKEVGFALFFHNFSTFLGRAGIYLEDLFVLPEYRGHGYGRSLMSILARIAWSAAAAALSGGALTGILQALSFTGPSARYRWMSGRFTASPERRFRNCQKLFNRRRTC